MEKNLNGRFLGFFLWCSVIRRNEDVMTVWVPISPAAVVPFSSSARGLCGVSKAHLKCNQGPILRASFTFNKILEKSRFMAIPVAKLMISVFMLLSASSATTEVPFMLVHKKASLNRLKSGAEHVLVSIDIYNQGSSSVFSFSLYFRF
ncbi:unnamed protein product [Arabis nemorensis]|uniref:Translocon-associated protein subunit beta n=1 Tax=Arabis nemorensis TaxID=586526 RepID=A0A565B2W6_9BRAS|nr:unnamed protein product [Arabis nemorensis]